MKSKEHIQDCYFNDFESFEEIVLKYRENSINFAKRYIKDIQICEDIKKMLWYNVNQLLLSIYLLY